MSFSEKSKLVDKRDRDNPFYGSYKENNILEEIHWQNKRKRQQLAMVAAVILILVILSIGITLAITLPALLGQDTLDPPDPQNFLEASPSILRQVESAAVSSESGLCSGLGRDVLEGGGTAVDAAVVVTLCHGVTDPQSSGLGGGLFMVIYDGNKTWALDAREVATSEANASFYEEDGSRALRGGLAVGVPSELLGLWEAHAKFGKVPWADLVAPVRELAENGVAVSIQLAKSLKKHEHKIKQDPVMSLEFMNPSTGSVWVEGDLLKRPRLAQTLRQVEKNGVESFYNGTLSTEIGREIGDAGGNIKTSDLSGYSVVWAEPIEYSLTGNLTMFSLPFPSSGPVVALALGILHGFGRKDSGALSAKERGDDEHKVVEVLKFAYTHRSLIADPDFSDMSEIMEQMLSTDYAAQLRSRIDDFKTFHDPQHYYDGPSYSPTEDQGTSHISVLGSKGDAVSLTTSINAGFGAGFMGDSTGIIYNNIMAEFSIGNVSGLLSNPYNEVEPGKRPASSMAPIVLVNSQGLPVLVTGASGGQKIISALISTTWRALYRALNLKEAIDYPRFIPQFNASQLMYEYGLPSYVVAELRRKGHTLVRLDSDGNGIGNVNGVCRTKQTQLILANADYRKHGDSAGF